MSEAFAASRLRSFIERIERLQDEIDDRNADKKDIFAEARGTGFDVKVMKALISERRKDPEAVREQSELLDLYRAAVNGTNVATRAPARVDFDPTTGEITETIPVETGSEESCGGVDGHLTDERSVSLRGDVLLEGSGVRPSAFQAGIEPGPQDTSGHSSAAEHHASNVRVAGSIPAVRSSDEETAPDAPNAFSGALLPTDETAQHQAASGLSCSYGSQGSERPEPVPVPAAQCASSAAPEDTPAQPTFEPFEDEGLPLPDEATIEARLGQLREAVTEAVANPRPVVDDSMEIPAFLRRGTAENAEWFGRT